MGLERTRLEYYLIFNVTRRDIIQEVELFEFKIIISSVLDSLYPPRDFLNVYKTKFCFYARRINYYRNSLLLPAVNNWNIGQNILNDLLQTLDTRQLRLVISKRR